MDRREAIEGEESTMSQPKSKLDCISRRQAIEAFCDDCRGLKPGQCEHWDKCKSQKALRSLSPVTPTEQNEEDILKFYYVESLDEYWIGQRCGTRYYGKWTGNCFTYGYSRYLPWGEHVVAPDTLWKEHTYPSEPKEIPFNEWLQGFLEKECQPERTGWIPVSERLPENIRPVLVTWKNNDPKSYYQYIVGKHFIGTAHYHKGKWHWYSSVTEDLLAEYGKCETEEFDEAIEVVAWMPLPEPYKGEELTMGQPKSKLKNPCDSLLTDDSEACKEQKSKLDCISRQQAIEAIEKEIERIRENPCAIATEGDFYYQNALKLAQEIMNKVPPVEDMGEVSDGYHTFNQLYHQRAVLFATIVNQNKDKAWKSWKHEDGQFCFDKGGEWFIVGVDTPKGSYTYHYEKKYWDMFDCEELDRGKHWDGHTEEDVTRLLSLSPAEPKPVSEDCIDRYAVLAELDPQSYEYKVVKELPSVIPQVPKRPKGEWIFKTVFPNDKSEFPLGYLVCPVCGSQHANATPCNYCDNCGAKMD